MKNNFKNRSQEITRFCDIVGRFLIYLLIFFLPLFFLPFTYDTLDFNKQFFLGILVFISLILWLIKSFFSGKFDFNSSFLNVPILVFILSNVLSLAFSSWRYSSFWGWPLNISQGFLTLIYFFTLYFLIINHFDKKKDILKLIFILVCSGIFVSTFSLLQIFGKFIFPWDFARNTSFNTIGSLNSLALFLAVLLPLGVLLIISSFGLVRATSLIAVIFFMISLVLINYKLIWIGLILGSSVLFIFGLMKFKKTGQMNLIFISIVFLIISLSFVAFSNPVNFIENTLGFSLPKFLPVTQFPTEVSISQGAEIGIAKNSLKNIKNLFLGSGQSTFIFNFLKFKPIDINKTLFWNVRFQAGVSEILDRLITTGVLGVLSLFFLLGTILWVALKSFIKKSKKEAPDDLVVGMDDSSGEEIITEKDGFVSICIFSSFLILVFGQFSYPVNFSLLFLFWFLIGIFVSLNSKARKRAKSSVLISVSLTLVFILGITLSFLLIKNYQAEKWYLSGLNSQLEGRTEDAISDLKKASDLSPKVDTYWRDISQFYLMRLSEISQNQGLTAEEFAVKSQELVNEATNAAKKATDVSPQNSINWINKGSIYRDLTSQFLGSGNWDSEAISSYYKASQLEPTNPQIFTEIGQLFVQESDILRQSNGEEEKINENLNKAKENFEMALNLKSDFAPALFQLALVFQREGKTKEAIEKMEETKLIALLDPLVSFQLGILYQNEGKTDLAKSEFERAIWLNPDYSNARYFLGQIYAKEGEKEKAIEQFEWIEKLNPEEEEIKTILKNLREGKPAF